MYSTNESNCFLKQDVKLFIMMHFACSSLDKANNGIMQSQHSTLRSCVLIVQLAHWNVDAVFWLPSKVIKLSIVLQKKLKYIEITVHRNPKNEKSEFSNFWQMLCLACSGQYASIGFLQIFRDTLFPRQSIQLLI